MRTAARVTALAGLTCLGACQNHSEGPEAWWHDSIGGKIDEQRPPPPGEKDPFPNLATVPAKPAAADTASWNRTTAGLMTDRINARQAAALAPIPAASMPAAASPQAGGQSPGASAALVAATPPQAARSPAPTRNPQAPLPELPAPGPAAPLSSAAAAQKVANGRLPALPTQAPPRPNIAPAPPAPLVPLTAAPPSPAPPNAGGVDVDFARSSATLNDPALAEIRSLAAVRGNRGIAITGYGDATTSDATGQSEAVTLGLSRAQALATALVARGVPYARLRLNAEAAGRGASLRLLQ